MAREARSEEADEDIELDGDGGEGGEGGVRPFWSGVLTFGLVSVPVELYAALGRSRVAMHLLGPDGQPLRRRYVSSADDHPLDKGELVRGYDTGEGFVTVSDEELQALEPERSREIDLRRFVARGEIDPVFCDKAWVLLPDGEVTKPYRLLAATMEKIDRAGIATFVMRGREQAIVIHAADGILHATTLRHPDEIRTPDDVGLPAPSAPDEARVAKLAKAIAAADKRGLDTRALGDEGAAALRALALAKKKAHRDVVAVAAPVPTGEAANDDASPILDIAQLLKERLGATKPAAPRAKASPAPPPARRATSVTSRAKRPRRASRA